MNYIPHPGVIIVGPSAGGVGKTTTAEVLFLLLTLMGLRVVVYDADPTVRGISARLGGASVTQLLWHGLDNTAPAMLARLDTDADVILVDLGAGGLMAGELEAVIADLFAGARERGRRAVLAAVASPSKPASEREIARLQAILRDYCEFWVVENDRDGSADFSPFARIEAPRWRLGFLEPALMAVRLRAAGQPILSLLREPPDSYVRATATIAHWIGMAARTPAAEQLLGSAVTKILTELAVLTKERPTRWYRGVSDASDAALRADAKKIAALQTLHRMSPDATDTELLVVARAYVAACARRAAI
ncbi:ATP-binding protein [Roseomonas harenae]|uniref:ATP-binding protein n=1 Tax=Muricoccus harenae TaxID=2692566 RepID=UPI0013314073|nr:ATP-binding protein [Roseomonas harenae]